MTTKMISVPIPTDLFIRLANFLEEQESPRDPVSVVADAVDYWMDNASWKQEVLAPETFNRISRGYTWKHNDRCLFLPHGTQIRQLSKGQYRYAKVEGDEINYNGLAVTPTKLANSIAGCSCNAWIHLWIKRPHDTDWSLADQLSPRGKSKLQAKEADRTVDQLV